MKEEDITMRTTLTIDDALARDLKQRAQMSGKSFKQVVNEALRASLAEARTSRPYRLQAVSLGEPVHGIDLAKALQLAEALENEALLAKLGQRK
jgi:Arc/MetJ family transcription regulator